MSDRLPRYPSRFVFIKGQDCLMPASSVAASVAEDPAGMAATQVLTPEHLSWPSTMIPKELFHSQGHNYVFSPFVFEGVDYGAVLLDESDRTVPAQITIESVDKLPVRQLASAYPLAISRFILLAKAHAQWASVSRFCGACGGALIDAYAHEIARKNLDDHADGARYCPHCGRMFFPRMSPAVITLIYRGDEILLGHNTRFPGNRHSLFAGFVELGETFEEAAAREIQEEAGVEVKNLRYIRSQPWPFPDSIMIGFAAEYASGTPRPDGVEIDHLGWYTAATLPELPLKGSIARALIDSFFSGALL